MIENALYFLLLSRIAQPVVKGRVLNLGLGPGLSAVLLLDSRRVEHVVSPEINLETTVEYMTRREANPDEARHTIIGDFLELAPDKGNFDWAYVDVLYDHDQTNYDNLRAIMAHMALPGMLSRDGCVTMELHGEHPLQDAFLKWLAEEGWTKTVVRSELAYHGYGRAGEMAIWRHSPA